ncbi:RICIN domain-containing protein [Microbacterium sp. MM2322]|uniref:RICIN domain-containing protein n=1 Tax=Microbacterium sp. MM2322 TaxID=3157631 RepID=UPI0032D570E8
MTGLTLPLGVPATASASWTTADHPATTAVSSGTLTITETGFPALATTYTTAALSTTAPLTLTNTGSIPAPYVLRLAADDTPLSRATDVHVWLVPTRASCTAGATTSGSAATWTTVAALTGTLAPAATAVYCVRTSLTQAQRFALAGGRTAATAVVTATQGAWTSTARSSATQTVADTVTPGATTKVSETDDSITIAWTAPSDSSAITGYRVYRGSALVATVPASQRQFTDTGLNVSTYYAYTVRAVGSTAGAVSPESPGVLHATGWLTTTSAYSIRNVASQRCVVGASGSTVAGEDLVDTACAVRSDQLWKFVVDGSYLKISPLSSAALFWDSPSTRNAILRTTSNISAQKWEVVPIAPGSGTFLLRNRNDLCMDAAASPALRVTECTSSTAQQFTLHKGA